MQQKSNHRSEKNFSPIIHSDIVFDFDDFKNMTEINWKFGLKFFQTSDLTFVASEFKIFSTVSCCGFSCLPTLSILEEMGNILRDLRDSMTITRLFVGYSAIARASHLPPTRLIRLYSI